MPLDSQKYLTKQGWRGHGLSLDNEGRGLKRPIVIAQKRNLGGVGQNRDRAVEWWDDVFASNDIVLTEENRADKKRSKATKEKKKGEKKREKMKEKETRDKKVIDAKELPKEKKKEGVESKRQKDSQDKANQFSEARSDVKKAKKMKLKYYNIETEGEKSKKKRKRDAA
ncbi:hypothetical protein MVES_000447 [Malassezia vespertilionis]|uniref:G-patch domain-containing protein n=1 Tax=Malassezia vespertilionis TaxID=2020962 RepID=A0A2N1JFW4_9BASI|nr:hypothetical protein MVES_000447 [Malassezia vespertilionis]